MDQTTVTSIDVTDPEIQLWPRLTRFYGLSFDELRVMPRPFVYVYLNEMPSLIAEEQLRAIEAASYAHMDEDGRNESYKRWSGSLKTDDVEAEAPILHDAASLAKIGIKFVKEEVPKDA